MSSHRHPCARVDRRPGFAWLGGMMLAAWLVWAVGARAQTTPYWDGGGSGSSWSTTNNWNPNSLPGTTSTVTFDADVANGKYAITLGANRTVAGIIFGATSSSNTFTLSGNTLTLGASGINNQDNLTQTIASAIDLNAAQTWNMSGGGGLLVSGALTFDQNLTISGSGAVSITGATSESGTQTLTNNNTAGVSFGAFSQGGNFTVSGSGSTSFTGTLTNSGGSRTFTNNATGTVTFNAINLSNNNTGRTWTYAGTGDAVVTGVIANGGSAGGNLIKTGGGTLTLAGNNTYSGTTTISAGTLQIGAGGTTGSVAGNITNNAALAFNRSDTVTYSGVVSGSGSLTQNGSGTLTLSGANTYTGATIVNAGTLATNAADRIANTSNLTINAPGTFTLGGSETVGALSGDGTLNIQGNAFTTSTAANTTFSGVISGWGTVTKAGTGDLTLSGNSTYSGLTYITGGTLIAASDNALGSSQYSNVISSGATLGLQGGIALNQSGFTLQGTGDGGVGAINNISGNNTLGAALNFGGATTIGSTAGSLTLSGSLNLGYALTTTGSGDIILSNNMYGGGSLTKEGTGTLTLSGSSANSFSGAANLNNGTTILAKAAGTNAIGQGALNIGDGVGVAGSTILRLDASNQIFDSSNVVIASDGRFDLNGNAESIKQLSGSGQVALGAGDLTIGTSGGGATTYSGVISGTGSLTKISNATLTLSGANTYTGATNIDAGTLTLGANHVLSDSTAVSIASGATFNVSGRTDTVGSIAGAGSITLGAGALTAGGDDTSTTFSGAVSGTGNFAKTGAGTLTLTGTNTYTGTTTINGGALKIGADNALGAAPGTATAGKLTLGGGTLQTTNTFTLNANRGIALTGSTTSNISADNGTTLTYGGVLAGAGNLSFGTPVTGTGTVVLSGVNTFTGSAAVNAGTLKIQNDYALGLGTASTTVASGATLQLDGSLGVGLANAQNGTLTLAGTGFGGAGALVGTNGNNRWANNIALSGDATITNANSWGYLALGVTSPAYDRSWDVYGITPPDTHTLDLGNHTLTLSGGTSTPGNRAIWLNASVTGTGNLVIDMDKTSDVVRMTANVNSFTGTTTIKNGELSLATLANTYPNDPLHPNFFGINGPLVIGDGVGAANSALFTIQANGGGVIYDEMMNFTTPVTLYQDGLFTLGAAQTIGGLTFNGGVIDLGATGGLYLDGDVTVNASAGHTAVISGTDVATLSLTIHQGGGSFVPNASRVFDVVGGVGNASDLTISARINNGSIVKNGAGTMTLAGDNSGGYEGTTTVNNGILAITHGNALGLAASDDASATIVNGNGTTNGTLQLSNNITVTGEKLTLNGTGFNGNGALQNLSGNNTWAGPVVVGDARVQSDAGLLTIAGATTIDTALEVRGASHTTISGDMGGATGTLTKNGTGTLTLSGDNTYGGATTINQGVLSLQSNTGLGAATAGTTVAGNGAALELSNAAHGNLNVVAEPLFLNGTGIGGNGALRNAAGNNTYSGLVTASTASLLTANSGTSLTLSGGVTSANQALTFGTTANNGNITLTGALTNGSGSLTKAGAGTLAINGATNTAGATHLNAGRISVGSGSTLNTGAFDSAVSTTLLIGSGGTVVANYASGSTTFSGAIDGSAGGTFQKDGAGTLVFDHSFDAGAGSTLVLNGGTLSLAGSQITFGTIHITADTVLDFNGIGGTVLSSANLIIDAGVTITVNNWVSVADNVSQSTVWYATSTVNTGTLSGSDAVGGIPLDQISFTNYGGLTTGWVAGNHDGWFDHELRPVPEPATYGLIFVGAGLAFVVWRKRRRK